MSLDLARVSWQWEHLKMDRARQYSILLTSKGATACQCNEMSVDESPILKILKFVTNGHLYFMAHFGRSRKAKIKC